MDFYVLRKGAQSLTGSGGSGNVGNGNGGNNGPHHDWCAVSVLVPWRRLLCPSAPALSLGFARGLAGGLCRPP